MAETLGDIVRLIDALAESTHTRFARVDAGSMVSTLGSNGSKRASAGSTTKLDYETRIEALEVS